MCQLTFVNLRNKELNSLFLYNQLLVNTISEHKDGYGFFSENPNKFIMKTNLEPDKTENLSEVIKSYYKTDGPILAHVRQASIINNIKSKVSEDKAHPFKNEKVVFAHNGTLKFRNEKEDIHSNLIDSEKFLLKFTEKYSDNFVQAINDTLELFEGTFAFLIYSFLDKKFYLVRGSSKKLYISYVRNKDGDAQGYVINTDQISLENGINRFLSILELLNREKLSFSKPELVEKESVFQLDEYDIVKIGSAVEYIKVVNNHLFDYWENYYDIEKPNTGPEKWNSFGNKYKLSYQELDELIYIVSDKKYSLLNISESYVNEFIEKIIPICDKWYSDAKFKIWNKISPKGDCVDYKTLKFPYFMNSIKDLEEYYEKNLSK